MKFLLDDLTDKAKNEAVGKLEGVAKELGCTLAQLALAWCARRCTRAPLLPVAMGLPDRLSRQIPWSGINRFQGLPARAVYGITAWLSR